MRPKLCYVLPEYRADDATHFSHIHDFLKEIVKYFDLFLIIEKGGKPPVSLGCTRLYVAKINFTPLRFFETLVVFIWARLSGYRDFYVHYSFSSAFAASLVSRLSRGRTFYWNCGEPWKYSRVFLREWFERIVYKMVTFQVTGAVSLADKYASHYHILRAKIKIMPNWIDLRRFRTAKSKEEARRELNIPPGKKVVLFAHRLSPRKGSRMIIPVARELIKILPETLFVVTGDGPDKERIAHEINDDTAVGKHVRLEGSIPNTEIPNYFAAADVFFMPSEEEGFPRVLLETMASGVPFVASDVGATRDIVPGFMSKYVIRTGDVKLFADKLCELIEKNNDKQKIISSELRKGVAKYDVVIVAKRFREMLI